MGRALGRCFFRSFQYRVLQSISSCAAVCVVESRSRAEQRGISDCQTGGVVWCWCRKSPSIYKDAGGKCLETEMTRFVKRHLNSCQIFVRRGKCKTNTAWILSTISETLPGHAIRIQVRHHLHARFNGSVQLKWSERARDFFHC